MRRPENHAGKRGAQGRKKRRQIGLYREEELSGDDDDDDVISAIVEGRIRVDVGATEEATAGRRSK